jgi:two-component sensor histidine kinase
MRELDHRSKNMLGLVLSIARQTASTGARDFIERFEERVQSLAAAQDVLVRSNWKAVPIADLVRSQLSHFEDLIDTRIAITGPPLALTLAASQSLGMALHELATNAAKYGALSDQHGDVAIDWRVDADGAARPRFTISWVEQGGPPVRAPQRRGFGTTVTSHMVEFSLGGEVAMDYAPDGVRWRLVCDADGILEGRSAPPRSGLPPARAAAGRIGSPAGSACWWSRTSR